MRPMPSSAVLIGSGSARERTPMPFSARSCTRLRTSRRLRPSRSRVCTTMVSPSLAYLSNSVRPGWFPEIGQADLFRFFTLTPADVALADNLIHPGGRWYAR
jgi:hypothetical protein